VYLESLLLFKNSKVRLPRLRGIRLFRLTGFDVNDNSDSIL
jgi:hypothetical protein